MADQAFDAALEGHGGRRTAGTGTVHREIEMALAIALVSNIAPVLRNCRPDAGLDQLLDLVDDVGIGRIFLEIAFRCDVDAGRGAAHEQRCAADEMIEEGLEDERLEVRP